MTPAHHIHWNREADAVGAQGLRQHGGVDADQLSIGVDERAAGVAEIDRRVGLNEVLEIRDAEPSAAGRADDALRHCLAETERIADGEDDIAGAQLVRSAQAA